MTTIGKVIGVSLISLGVMFMSYEQIEIPTKKLPINAQRQTLSLGYGNDNNGTAVDNRVAPASPNVQSLAR